MKLFASEPRREASGRSGSRVACYSLALALVPEGASRTQAAQSRGMDWQMLRDWVRRYHACGIEGLSSRTGPGRPAALLPERIIGLKALVLARPDQA